MQLAVTGVIVTTVIERIAVVPKLTAEACRAARALLNWSVRDLMDAAGVSPNTVTALEGGAEVRAETAAKIVAAFAAHNVEITNGGGTGARLKQEGRNPRYVVDERGLPAVATVWHIELDKAQPGWWRAYREPPEGHVSIIRTSRKAVEDWLDARGFSPSSVDPDVWTEPL